MTNCNKTVWEKFKVEKVGTLSKKQAQFRQRLMMVSTIVLAPTYLGLFFSEGVLALLENKPAIEMLLLAILLVYCCFIVHKVSQLYETEVKQDVELADILKKNPEVKPLIEQVMGHKRRLFCFELELLTEYRDAIQQSKISDDSYAKNYVEAINK